MHCFHSIQRRRWCCRSRETSRTGRVPTALRPRGLPIEPPAQPAGPWDGRENAPQHLAALVMAGLIVRRDSPNGKRYARRSGGEGDRPTDAFGFDLTPLVARAVEFEAMADEARRDRQRQHLQRERISLFRRDAAKLIALGLEQEEEGPWEALRQRYMRLLTPLRTAARARRDREPGGRSGSSAGRGR